MSGIIRKATPEDCPRIAEIHVFGWRSAYIDFIPPDHLFNKMTVKKREAKFMEYFNDEKTAGIMYVYESDKIIKAFMTIGDCRDDDKDEYAFELQGIYVDPFFQRRHIGTELVEFCIREGINRNKKEIVLWVFEKNRNSIEFYKKMGFAPDGKIMNKDPFNENAIRLSLKI